MEVKFEVRTKIQRPLAEVFDAVYNPTKLTRYFTTDSASGPLEEGKQVEWRFADYNPSGANPPAEPMVVRVTKVVTNQLIAFEWAATDGPYNTRVELRFEALRPDETLVTIVESGWKDTVEGREASYGNCMGWTQMSCCLKAFLEYGINLRQGYF